MLKSIRAQSNNFNHSENMVQITEYLRKSNFKLRNSNRMTHDGMQNTNIETGVGTTLGIWTKTKHLSFPVAEATLLTRTVNKIGHIFS